MKARPIHRELTSSHWGAYEVLREGDRAVGLRAHADDPDPSPIGPAMWQAYQSPVRVQRPAVRAGWLDAHAAGRRDSGVGRGREPFIEVDWETAVDLVAGRVTDLFDMAAAGRAAGIELFERRKYVRLKEVA